MYLYEAIRLKLGTRYPNIMYQMVRDDVEGDVGIFFYESSNDLRDIPGNDVYDCIKVHVQVNCPRTVEGLWDALAYISEFVERIENEQSNLAQITFIEAVHLGPRAVAVGRNKYDIQIVKCDIDLKYVFNNI